MPKPNPLTQGLEKRTAAAPVPAEPDIQRPAKITAPSRANRVLVAGHFSPAVQTALKVVAAEERTTVQKLLAEGINTILAKRGRPEIADLLA